MKKHFFQSFLCKKKTWTSYIYIYVHMHKEWQYWSLEKEFQMRFELFKTQGSVGSSDFTFAQGCSCQKEVKSIDKKHQQTNLIVSFGTYS